MMRLLDRLRRTVALIICPEMGVEARLKAARAAGAFDCKRVGFFDLEDAKVTARNRAALLKASQRESDDSVSVGVQDIVSCADAPDHDAAALSVRFVELAAALPAGQSVMGDGLKDRLDLFLIAGCANAVRGLAVGVALVKFIHERALFGAGERVANGLGLKAVDATLFLLKIQKSALHRYLLRLKPDQSIEQVRDELFRRSGIDIRLIDQGLDVLSSVRGTLGEAYEAGACGKEGRDGL